MRSDTSFDTRFDAVVLAGGRAARLGGTPKPGLVVAGATLLDHALAATRDAERTVVVGPPEALPGAVLGAHPGRRLARTREDPPFGGPVAGIDAGLRASDGGPAAPWVVVLAVDVPRAASAVPHVVDALAGLPTRADGAWLVRGAHPQWLVGGYRRDALLTALDDVRDAAGSVHDVPVKRLVACLACVGIPDTAGWSDDVDTWEDVRAMSAGPGSGATRSRVGEGTA